ncbi:MAG: DUF4954 family protein [Spirochaetes bacterium]|nr:DUF4954 family protein [Spirochaetota bacterium]
MSQLLANLTGGILKESEFLKSIELLKNDSYKSRLFKDAVRTLSDEEIDQLKKQGNICDDWGALLVADGFTADCIFSSAFHGSCRLGALDGTRSAIDCSTSLPAGIYRSTIINAEIGNGCVIHDAGIISNCVVNDGAVLVRNGSITASGSCTFGNGVEIAVGNETGGREILSYAELTIPVAEAVAKRRSDRLLLNDYKEFIGRYVEKCTAPAGYIGKRAIIRNSSTIEDAYVGDGVVIFGATLVKNCTILATPEEKTEIRDGAFVRDSCIQWGSEVASMALVDKSVLCEHSHVERHGKVTMSVIGPNTGIAEGEVTSCLLGPFVGFHHQSMLIAGIWPEGKGNIAYGANIGSNHTSKSPDQEIWCGEGLFFGLGTNIKFPSDFTKAPYSIIATGVDTLPQKLVFPFSLINKPAPVAPGVPPSFNELFPGWVLSNNIYAIRRNEGKYKKRNKARRSSFTFAVFRPDIIDLMVLARDALKQAVPVKAFYTDADIPGIGKNFMTDRSRMSGIEAYELYIEYYCLTQMLNRVISLRAEGKAGALAGIHDEATGDRDWEHARKLIEAEGHRGRTLRDSLARLIDILRSISESTLSSKARDDARGARIIPDYYDVNTAACDDSFIKETVKETAGLTEQIQAIIKTL